MWKAVASDADTTPGVVLQRGVGGMQLQLWQNNQWRSKSQLAQQQPNVVVPQVPTGLQVALTVNGKQAPMSKSFLLGGSI
jgi:general secretion pathway protein J